MPRGNDAETARRDLDTQYGEHANAEELIRAHDEKFDPIMNAALQKPVDQVATDAIDLDDIEPTLGGEVASAAVRGGVLVVVELVNGEYKKWLDTEWKGLPTKRRNPAASDTPPDPAVTGNQGQAGSGSTGDGELDLSEPGKVKSEDIQKKLEELQIDKGEATNKGAYWALLPDAARKELAEAAAAA